MIGASGTIAGQSVNGGMVPFPGNIKARGTGQGITDTLALPFGVCYNRPVGQYSMTDNARDPEDAEYIDRIINGDKNAFSSIIKKYKMYVLKIVSRHIPYEDAEEVAHDAFIRIYGSLAQFKGPDGFRQWMAAITTRTCYDYWRRAYRSKEVPMSSLSDEHREWLDRVASEQVSIEDIARQAEAREVLDYALSKLSAEDRMVLELVYMEGLSVREVADLLGFSSANVKIRSFRSRKKLHKLLKDAGRR
ncbi:MAG: rpoE [Deltaproteobacteria bacterium]|nr:rpoE [Deltaproteobacteria bacterium]